MSLLLENFCLNIFYDNVLLHFGSEWVKIHNVKKKKFLLYTIPTKRSEMRTIY